MAKSMEFLKTSIIYLLGNTFTKLLSFLLLPLHTANINPADFGFYNITTSALSVIVPFCAIEIWTGVLRFMLDYQNPLDKQRTIFTGFSLFGVSTGLIVIIYGVLKVCCSIPFLEWICLYAIVQTLNYIYLSIVRGYGKNALYAFSGMVCSVVSFILNVVLILGFHMGVEAIYIAFIIGMMAQDILIESKVHALKCLSPKMFNKNVFRTICLFCLPLSFNTICYWFSNGYNSVAISSHLGLSENGIYSVAVKFGSVLTLLTTCFTLALQEMIYKESKKEGKGLFYSKTINYYFKFIAISILFIIPAVKIVFPLFVHETYASSLSVVPLYFLGSIVGNYAIFIGNYFLSEKRTHPVTITLLIAGVLNFILVNLLIDKYGLQAANISLLIAYAVAGIIRLYLFNKQIPIHFDIKFLGVFAVLYLGTSYIFTNAGNLINILWAILMCGVFFYYFKELLMPILKSIGKKLKKQAD